MTELKMILVIDACKMQSISMYSTFMKCIWLGIQAHLHLNPIALADKPLWSVWKWAEICTNFVLRIAQFIAWNILHTLFATHTRYGRRFMISQEIITNCISGHILQSKNHTINRMNSVCLARLDFIQIPCRTEKKKIISNLVQSTQLGRIVYECVPSRNRVPYCSRHQFKHFSSIFYNCYL